MRVVHLSTSDSGGAGLAALRLNRALNQAGVDSYLLCRHKNSDDPKVIAYDEPIWAKIIRRISFIPYRQNKYSRYIGTPEMNRRYESYTFPEAIYDVSCHPLLRSADVINLHWLGSSVNYRSFFKNTSKPIVWTLHDKNPFLGIAHFDLDRENNQDMLDLELKVERYKHEAISKSSNLTVVALCNWMASRVGETDVFKNRPLVTIANSIDTEIFKPLDEKEGLNRVALRKDLGIPSDATVFMFCSQHMGVRRKGMSILRDATHLVTDHKVFYLTVGCGESMLDSKNSIHVDSVSEERRMVELYNIADAFIISSIEDNLPNTMLESLCCGTPVISFSNGGMRDVIRDGANGLLVPESNAQSLADKINLFINNQKDFSRERISEDSRNAYSPLVQASNYISLYEGLIR